MTVLENDLLVLIVALLIGAAIAWWLVRSRRTARPAPKLDRDESGALRREARPPVAPPQQPVSSPEAPLTPPPAAEPVAPPTPAPRARSRADTPEGNSLIDQGAAATGDVAGAVLGVEAHGQLPGAKGPPDDLQKLKGVGPKLVQLLNENGITRFDQIAALTPNEVEFLDAKLGAFKGRLSRDRVVEQASYLARGDTDGFQARFGNLGGGRSAPPFSS